MADPIDPPPPAEPMEPTPDGGRRPPGDGAPPPGDGEPPPGDGEPPPGDGEPPPGDGEPPPGDGEPPPGDGEPPPGDGEPPAEDDEVDPAVEEALARKEARRRTWARRRRRVRDTLVLALKVIIVVVLLTVIIFFDRIVHSVYPGEIGVLWSRFFGGTQVDYHYPEGLVLTFPWDKLYIYEIREQEARRTTVIYAQDGLEITVNTSVRFRPRPLFLPRLHKEIGPDYVQKIVVPETISTLRRVLGNYTPEMIYAKDEQGLLAELSATLRNELDAEYFEVTEFLVLELRLPVTIENAIKDKLTQEQQMLSYRFRLEREKDEKERRIIEAEGLKAFETISGVPILKWRGIEATEALASAPSSKVVLMGTGQELPIILNADTAPAPAPAPASAPAPAPAPAADAEAADRARARNAGVDRPAVDRLGERPAPPQPPPAPSTEPVPREQDNTNPARPSPPPAVDAPPPASAQPEEAR